MAYSFKRGFTLIELVIVIVILAILAIVAIPKFLNFSKDAQIAKLEEIKSNLSNASKLIYAKSVLAGKTSGTHTLPFYNHNIEVVGGYPSNSWNNGVRRLFIQDRGSAWGYRDNCIFEFCGGGGAGAFATDEGILQGAIVIWPEGYAYDTFCNVAYLNPGDGQPPQIVVSTSGC